ncbi:MAG: pyrroline-5-carboxylate reductase [Pseudomonadota bacterium]
MTRQSDKLSKFPKSVTLLGGGNMGRAMLEGWLSGGLPGAQVGVIDPHPSGELSELATAHGFRIVSTAPDLTAPIQCLVIAVKPQFAQAALATLDGLLTQDTIAISLAAGKTLAFLEACCAPAKVVRTIPNTPALVGRGATGAIAGDGLSPEQRDLADRLLSAVGLTVWVDKETDIDAITALSGSGPAYLFHMVEAMAQAGEALGLNTDMAQLLARATVEGAGELLHRSDRAASALRANVTSPGGTTAAALDVLMDQTDGLPPLMTKALKAAKQRSEDLA